MPDNTYTVPDDPAGGCEIDHRPVHRRAETP